MISNLPNRIIVIGTTGSGKTMLARSLAGCLGVPHVELDALHWDPGWTPAPPEVFRARVEEALSGPAWVTDGNYGKARDIVWSRVQLAVWLDYSFPVVLKRLFCRTARCVFIREELWNGNRERFIAAFLSRESLFIWLLKSYGRRRRDYPLLLMRPEYAHLKLVRFASPEEAERWLAEVAVRNA
ncbi:MAG: adenylate kinase [Armatimonadetes bacterium]|nr:adenylate kinase [Armatimonadota bacterium]